MRVKIFFKSGIFILSAAAAALCCLSGCGLFKAEPSEPAETEKPNWAQDLPERHTPEEEKIVNFSTWSGVNLFHAAHGYGNGGMFDCVWNNGNAVISDGQMNMSITAADNRFYGAEYRSFAKYSYGFFSVSMKAAKCSGTVSSFFTYDNGTRDEIDIEFLGKDTTVVQFNYYKNGVGGHEYIYSLGFDASKEFHEYAFDWRTDCIIWYIDGKPIYKAEGDMPSHSGQIMMNVWNGKGVDGWLGAFDKSKVPVTAQYKWIGYKAA